MKQFTLDSVPFEKDQIKRILNENDVLINHYAEEYFSHPDFMTDQTETVHIVITSLHEIGFKNGASLPEIFDKITETGLKPCPVNTGLYLRNVNGNNWLRGYICSLDYRFPADALFVFQTGSSR